MESFLKVNIQNARQNAARRRVLAALDSGERPAREDLDLALDDTPGEPIPRAIIDYVRRIYLRGVQRRPGPDAGSKNRARDDTILMRFRRIMTDLQAAEQSHDVRIMAVQQTAKEFRVSVRTVYRVLKRATKVSVFRQPRAK